MVKHKLFTSIIVLVLITISSIAMAAGEIWLENEWYKQGKPVTRFVKLYQTDNPYYYRYINGRYGMGINVPSNFNRCKFPVNGDGCTFLDEYGSTFSVSGMHNVIGITAESRYNEIINQHPEAPLKSLGDTWYAVSYVENGNIVYLKGYVNSQYMNTFSFVYSADLGYKYNEVCAAVEPTFTPGWLNPNRAD